MEKFDYESIHKAIMELIEAGRETDRRLEKLGKKTDRRIADTNKSLEHLKKLVGGMNNNQGQMVEEEFFNSFLKSMRLGDLEFHSIDRNIRRHIKDVQDEFDIVLTNSEIIMIVEVKLKFHPNDVKNVLNKIANFKKLFPHYQHYKIYGAIAAKILTPDNIEEAKKYNLFVVAHESSELRLLNNPYK